MVNSPKGGNEGAISYVAGWIKLQLCLVFDPGYGTQVRREPSISKMIVRMCVDHRDFADTHTELVVTEEKHPDVLACTQIGDVEVVLSLCGVLAGGTRGEPDVDILYVIGVDIPFVWVCDSIIIGIYQFYGLLAARIIPILIEAYFIHAVEEIYGGGLTDIFKPYPYSIVFSAKPAFVYHLKVEVCSPEGNGIPA